MEHWLHGWKWFNWDYQSLKNKSKSEILITGLQLEIMSTWDVKTDNRRNNYENIYEWYSEVSILTTKYLIFRETEKRKRVTRMNSPSEGLTIPTEITTLYKYTFILIAIIPDWVNVHVQRISISINIIINCVTPVLSRLFSPHPLPFVRQAVILA